MSTPSLYEMLTFSFSGELPLEQVSERDQLILSVMDNMQRIINCRAGSWRLVIKRDELEADKPRSIELMRSDLRLLPLKDK